MTSAGLSDTRPVQPVLNDTSVKILAALGLALHLGAPALGWSMGSMRVPVSGVVTVTGVVLLGVALVEGRFEGLWVAARQRRRPGPSVARTGPLATSWATSWATSLVS